MDNLNDDARASSSRRLVFSQENFDDYLLALMAKLRHNEDADRLLSGETQHPLVQYQVVNHNILIALTMPFSRSKRLSTTQLVYTFSLHVKLMLLSVLIPVQFRFLAISTF